MYQKKQTDQTKEHREPTGYEHEHHPWPQTEYLSLLHLLPGEIAEKPQIDPDKQVN